MESKNNVGAIALAIIITAVVVGGGVYWWQQSKVVQEVVTTNTTKTTTADKEESKEPITYSTSGVSASVSKNTAPFDYTADQLKSMAEECGTQHEAGYFDKLVAKFNGATKTVYNFKYQGNSQDAGSYIVTLLPNKAGYTSLDQFKKDFDICSVGGDAYPTMLNSSWLLFVNSCGSGFDDGSGRPHGCDEVKEIIEPSLKLN